MLKEKYNCFKVKYSTIYTDSLSLLQALKPGPSNAT